MPPAGCEDVNLAAIAGRGQPTAIKSEAGDARGDAADAIGPDDTGQTGVEASVRAERERTFSRLRILESGLICQSAVAAVRRLTVSGQRVDHSIGPQPTDATVAIVEDVQAFVAAQSERPHSAERGLDGR